MLYDLVLVFGPILYRDPLGNPHGIADRSINCKGVSKR